MTWMKLLDKEREVKLIERKMKLIEHEMELTEYHMALLKNDFHVVVEELFRRGLTYEEVKTLLLSKVEQRQQ